MQRKRRALGASAFPSMKHGLDGTALLDDSHCVFATPMLTTLLIAGFAQGHFTSLCLVYHE